MEGALSQESLLAQASRMAENLAREPFSPVERGEARPSFDVTSHLRALCVDICTRLPELAHVEMNRVSVRFCQTRSRQLYGMQASLTPLRFEGGAQRVQRSGRWWAIDPICDGAGREMLYLLSFYLPRFLNHSFHEKLTTVFHELWHIGPQFDGDVRRRPGRCYAHGPSEREFHAGMDALAERWLALDPPCDTYRFLAYDFAQLVARHGRICGTRIATPKVRLAQSGL